MDRKQRLSLAMLAVPAVALSYVALIVFQFATPVGGTSGLMHSILFGLPVVLLLAFWWGSRPTQIGLALVAVGFAVFYFEGVFVAGFGCRGGTPNDLDRYVLLFDTLQHTYHLAEATGSAPSNTSHAFEVLGNQIYAGPGVARDRYWQCVGRVNLVGIVVGPLLTAAGLVHAVEGWDL